MCKVYNLFTTPFNLLTLKPALITYWHPPLQQTAAECVFWLTRTESPLLHPLAKTANKVLEEKNGNRDEIKQLVSEIGYEPL